MKSIFFAVAVVISQVSFAGPEERLNNNCFLATSEVPQGMSAYVCYEGLSLGLQDNKLYSGASQMLPSKMELTSLIRKTEDVYMFVAQPEVMNVEESVCGKTTRVTLKISGRADFIGVVDESSVKIDATVEVNNDWCHGYPEETSISFVRVN